MTLSQRSLLATEKFSFQVQFIVQPGNCHDPDKRFRIIQPYQLRKRFLVRVWRHEHALLKLMEFRVVQMLAQNSTERPTFLWNVEGHYAPFSIPGFRSLKPYTRTKKTQGPRLPIPFSRKHEIDRPIRQAFFRNEFMFGKTPQDTIHTSAIDLLPFLPEFRKQPNLLHDRTRTTECDESEENEKCLLLYRSQSIHNTFFC